MLLLALFAAEFAADLTLTALGHARELDAAPASRPPDGDD